MLTSSPAFAQIQLPLALDGLAGDTVYVFGPPNTTFTYTVTHANATVLGLGTLVTACRPGTCTNQVNYTVATVASVEYVTLDSPSDTNPNAGGGLRMYPDKTSSNDTVNRRLSIWRWSSSRGAWSW